MADLKKLEICEDIKDITISNSPSFFNKFVHQMNFFFLKRIFIQKRYSQGRILLLKLFEK